MFLVLSDAVAQLSAFAAWEDARVGGEQAEINFCDYKGLSMPVSKISAKKILYMLVNKIIQFINK